MKKFLLLFLPAVLMFYSCGRTCEELTQEEILKEKDAIISMLKSYNKAFQEKNFAGVVPTLSENIHFFGTDSAEVITSLQQYKKVVTDQFASYDQMVYGDIVDSYIEVDKFGSFASIIYGLPATIYKGGKTEKLFLRIARTLKKEGGNWRILSGIVGITNKATAPTTPLEGQ